MKRYNIEEVLKHVVVPDDENLLRYSKKYKKKVDFDGDSIKVSSDRLLLFKTKGCKCVVCGIEGTYFQKTPNGDSGTFHFNLYATNEEGEKVLMTKDHIQPKSKGGLDCQANYQTMCEDCNMEKGAKV